MEFITEIIILALFVYPGAVIRWVLTGFRRPLKDFLNDDSYFNGTVGLVVIVGGVMGVLQLLERKKNTLEEGRVLVEQNCASCHTKYEYRMMSKPSLLQMREMGDAFKASYRVALGDSIHYVCAQQLTTEERENIYNYIVSLERAYEDRITDR
nr:cytochrome c [uncultured Chitinophaga sp.]